ncbi:P-loop NTPase fold protein [Vibrio vulnificus]|uniref:P-loop NTPase fold protein n=1 Tax=Vibrio vulnificus TaxID=672 RepID=UPI001A19F3B5|nr:P-loop NTPase fold protein [Vibrio vulnificus]MCG8703417.1 hypothetical protein [Vibrio vulnificus]HAS8153162.1 hypothetical protein [Vibrio vulnificus]
MTSVVTRQILEQLNDDSHPPIILLDGDWGIGKTYLIEKELKPLVEERPQTYGDFHYLSAYGMRSVTDFQDQVVSLFLAKNKNGSAFINSGLNQVSNIARALGADKSEAGLVQGVMSGMSGMVRQGALKNLSDMTIVLDDLERLNNQNVIADILGTCLRFAEHNKLKIIVVANSSAISDNTKLEKTFSDIVKLTRTDDELIEILSSTYRAAFDATVESAIRQTLDKTKSIKADICNLRVLKRIINRICKLRDRVETIEIIDRNKALQVISQQIAGVCLYAYAKNYKETDVIEFYKRCMPSLQASILRALRAKNKTGTNEDNDSTVKDQEDFDKIFGSNGLNETIIHYCFSNLLPSVADEQIIKLLSLPRTAQPLDTLTAGNLYMLTEEEFEIGLVELEKLLFDTEQADYYDWVSGCDTYLFLVENDYVDKTKDQALQDLKTCLESGNAISPESVNSGQFRRRLRLPKELESENFKNLLQPYLESAKKSKENDFVHAFYDDWQNAVHNHNQDLKFESFFYLFDPSELLEHITQWSPWQINEFIIFIRGRNSVQMPEVFGRDAPFLSDFLPLLNTKIAEIEKRLKKGVLAELALELKISFELGIEPPEADNE